MNKEKALVKSWVHDRISGLVNVQISQHHLYKKKFRSDVANKFNYVSGLGNHVGSSLRKKKKNFLLYPSI